VPAFLADKAALRINTTSAFFTPTLTASNAVYAIFIGTNDLGNDAFLTNSQVPGKVLSDYTSCVFSAFDTIYASGGRNFVLMNNIPLHLTPQYANDTLDGANATQYYPEKGSANHTEIAEKMHEAASTTNTVFQYETPYEVLVGKRYPGANFAVFDTYSLFSDVYHNPAAYLNGSAPLNVTGFEHHCNTTGADCAYVYDNTSPDSFMWYDELHLRYVRSLPKRKTSS